MEDVLRIGSDIRDEDPQPRERTFTKAVQEFVL